MSDEMKKIIPGAPLDANENRMDERAEQPAGADKQANQAGAPDASPAAQTPSTEQTAAPSMTENASGAPTPAPDQAASQHDDTAAVRQDSADAAAEAVSAMAAAYKPEPGLTAEQKQTPLKQAPTSATPAEIEKAEKEKPVAPADKAGGSTILSALKLGGILFLVAAIMAVMLASVNEMTKGPIADNERRTLEEMISTMFPESTGFTEAPVPEQYQKDIAAIYEIQSSSGGVCVHATPTGFGGAIDLLVGFHPDGSISSVKVLSMSETAGIGTKTAEDAFLDQYLGKSGHVEIGGSSEQGVSAISGATISSKAVTLGVNNALSVYSELYGGASVPAGSDDTGDTSGEEGGNASTGNAAADGNNASAGTGTDTPVDENSDTQDGGNE